MKKLGNIVLTGIIISCLCGIAAHYAAPYVKAYEKEQEVQQYLALTVESESTSEEFKFFEKFEEVTIVEPETTPDVVEVPKRLRASDIFSENTMGYVTIGNQKVVMGYGYGEFDENGKTKDLDGQCFLNLQSDANHLVIKGHCTDVCFLPLYWQKEGSIITVQFDAAIDEVTRYEVAKIEWVSDADYIADSCAVVYENDYDVTFVTCKSEKQDGEKVHGCLLVRCNEVE